MRTMRLGKTVIAAGMACILLYILPALRRPSTFDEGAGNILFYVGVVALPLGLVLLWTGVMKHRGE